MSREFWHKILGLFGGPFSGDSGIPGRSDSSRKEDPGSPITSRTGSEEIPAQDLRDTEDEMPVGNLPEHVGTVGKLLPKRCEGIRLLLHQIQEDFNVSSCFVSL